MTRRINTSEYGVNCLNGDVYIGIGSDVIGFEIEFNGKFELENYDVPNWLITSNNKNMIGISLDGSVLGNQPFLKYTGKFNILNCIIYTKNMEKKKIVAYSDMKDLFTNQSSTFDSESSYCENLDNGDNVIGKKVSKTKINIVNKNFHSKGGLFTLDGEDYLGDYHILGNGTFMTDSEPSDTSMVLVKNKRKQNLALRDVIRSARGTGTRGGY